MATVACIAAVLCAIAMACGSGDDTAGGNGNGDASTGDGASALIDGANATDAGASPDGAAPSDAATADSPAFGAVGDAAAWEAFDLGTLDPGLAYGADYFSAGFDGRYLYFAPYDRNYLKDAGSGLPNGIVVRFDTQGAFGDKASWTTFDLETNVSPNAHAFLGAAFDGRYIQFEPGYLIATAARYDTKGAFNDPASWTTTQRTFASFGIAFDDRFVYMPGAMDQSQIARLDPQATYDAGWSVFDVRTVIDAGGFYGALYDGRYTYFVPGFGVIGGAANQPYGIVPRFDSKGSFADAASWTSFDVSSVDPKAKGFAGAVFDGRYAYLVPFANTGGPIGVVARYDTQAAFGAPGSWITFDTQANVNLQAAGFIGGVFDGRFVYFAPFYGDMITRYDTEATFTDPTAWSTFKGTSVNPKASQFHGGAFDGRYVYFVPGDQGVMLRFDARTPPALPPSYHGSFL
jgi:hypothetical protein